MSVAVICGSRLTLRPLLAEDVGEAYVGWLNDPETVRYTEARHTVHTVASVRDFVAACHARMDTHLLGIFEQAGGLHVGNIKLGPVNMIHLCASVGLIIGEKTRWRLGYATEAIGLASRYAFEDLKLHKLTARMVRGNEASLQAFRKNGFVEEGVQRKQNLFDSVWHDEIMVGLLAEDRVHA
jgi:RimJ/RimL family protein N-acetyltransferase